MGWRGESPSFGNSQLTSHLRALTAIRVVQIRMD
jgi:hypothetical protein